MGQLDGGHLPGRGRGRRRAASQSRRPSELAVVTQTTLSVDDAARDHRRGEAALPERARAQAAGHLLRHAEPPGRGEGAWRPRSTCVIVVGSPTSSNSNRLRELAERLGTPAYMVDTRRRPAGPSGSKASAASASPPARRRPRCWCSRSSSACARSAPCRCASMAGVEETVKFPLPLGLGDKSMGRGDKSSAGFTDKTAVAPD